MLRTGQRANSVLGRRLSAGGRERALCMLERGALVLGAVLLIGYGGVRAWSEAERAQGVAAFREAEAASRRAGPPHGDVPSPPGPAPASTAPSQVAVDQSLWSAQRVRAFAASIASAGPPSAVLAIPSLALEVPVYADLTELNLDRGAAHIAGTAAPGERGNVGLAAHRDGFFRKLKDITIDADVHLEAGGRRLHYRVVEIGVVTPSDTHVLTAGNTPSITLVTCYPFYFVGPAPQRYIVRAELVEPAPLAES